MKRALPLFCLTAAAFAAAPLMAQDTAALKCSAGQDRVWLYDSLATLDVQAKLKCGDSVQILGREKAFVKVRTHDGAEGYVPDTSLPKPSANEVAQKAPEQMSLADQARAARAARANRAVAASSASASVAAQDSEPKAVAIVPKVEKRPEPRPEPQPSGSLQPAAASADHDNIASRTVVAVETSKKAPEPVHVTQPAASTPTHSSLATQPASANPAKEKASAGKSKAAQPQAPPAPPAPKPSHTTVTNTSSASNVTPAPSPKSRNSGAHSGPVGAGTSAPHAVAVSSNLNAEPPRTVAAVAKPSQDDDPDSEDYPERRIEDESANPACTAFFSVYGLTPNQYKWLASDRGKKYPSVCPAPSLNMVDYVLILTHDVPFYNSTMPTAVHTDHNGFSDFTPLSMVDSSLLSASDLEKSKHEYVWVFKTKRGAFDPARFSPRRKPQFTKLESNSHASDRTVEDAFRFIVEGGMAR